MTHSMSMCSLQYPQRRLCLSLFRSQFTYSSIMPILTIYTKTRARAHTHTHTHKHFLNSQLWQFVICSVKHRSTLTHTHTDTHRHTQTHTHRHTHTQTHTHTQNKGADQCDCLL